MYFIEAFLILRESEDDETPQRASFASEEAHREPAESVVYFWSGMLRRILYQLLVLIATTLFVERTTEDAKLTNRIKRDSMFS